MALAAMQHSPRRRIVPTAAALVLAGLTATVHAADQPQKPGAPAAATTAPAKPVGEPPKSFLDLRLGDLRRFFSPAELRAPAREDGSEDIVVESRRAPRTPDADRRPVPVGIIAPFWALSHPLSAWRIFLPDPNRAPAERPDPVPPLRQN